MRTRCPGARRLNSERGARQRPGSRLLGCLQMLNTQAVRSRDGRFYDTRGGRVPTGRGAEMEPQVFTSPAPHICAACCGPGRHGLLALGVLAPSQFA